MMAQFRTPTGKHSETLFRILFRFVDKILLFSQKLHVLLPAFNFLTSSDIPSNTVTSTTEAFTTITVGIYPTYRDRIYNVSIMAPFSMSQSHPMEITLTLNLILSEKSLHQ